MELTVSVIYGSVRTARKGIKAARYLEKKLLERNLKVHFIDPMDYKLPLLDKMFKEYNKEDAPPQMSKLSEIFRASDGFVIVTGEYNHSIPPALKNLLDHFQKEYFFKPSAIASYSISIFGGARAAAHVRSVVAELGMPSISSILSFPNIEEVFDENLVPTKELVEKSTTRFINEFIWYAEALKIKREKGTPY